jgi:Raf kinase inhibitor-like YbhB/YbcL family protein
MRDAMTGNQPLIWGYATWRRAGVLLTVCLCAMVPNASFIAAQTSPKLDSAFKLETTAFKPGGDIPRKFTCDGEDVSPALTWTNPSLTERSLGARSKSFAVIVEDPDAPSGTFVHWIVYNLPDGTRKLREGADKGNDKIAGGGRQGRNDFGNIGYNGPCPPPGKPHRYFFRLYYVDSMLITADGFVATKKELEHLMKDHVVEAELMGKYQRK